MNNCSRQLSGTPVQSIQKGESQQRRWSGCLSIGGRECGARGDDSPGLGRLRGDGQPPLQVTLDGHWTVRGEQIPKKAP